jgi:hypothetical protein
VLAPLSLGLAWDQIYSVDFNPDKYHRILNSRKHAKSFLSKINLMSKITVSLEQIEHSVNLICDRLGALEVESSQQALTKYEYQIPMQDIGAGEWKSKILRDFWAHIGVNSERKFYDRFDAITEPELCSEIAADGPEVDALFLNCGE